MFLVLLFATWVNGQVAQLGDDSFAAREAATARLDSVFMALFLPTCSEDPEINHRLRELSRRRGKWLDAVYVERRVYRSDWGGWLAWYLVSGRSRIAEERDTFEDIHRDVAKVRMVFRAWPPIYDTRFLLGSIIDGEYEQWLDYLDYHQGRAPAPAEK